MVEKKLGFLCGKYFDYRRDINMIIFLPNTTKQKNGLNWKGIFFIYFNLSSIMDWSKQNSQKDQKKHTICEEYKPKTSIDLLQRFPMSCLQNVSHKLTLLKAELVTINAEVNNGKSKV